jgi:hypothetical protein
MKSRWRRYIKVKWQYSKCRPTLIEIHLPRRILPSRSGRSTTWTRDVAARNSPVLWRQVCVAHHQDHPTPRAASTWYHSTRQFVGSSCGIQLSAKRANCWSFDGLTRLATNYVTMQLESWAMRIIRRHSGGTQFEPNQVTDPSHWGFAVTPAEYLKSNSKQVGSRGNTSDSYLAGAYFESWKGHWLSWLHFRDFLQSVPENVSIVVKLGQDIFLPHISHSLFTIIQPFDVM